ncbi:hypothetical protein EVAR_73418_1 [Eumeta japonica]|uniref:Uncharacterized protein n=1 Tax=Eumeta variegata TaxID=151549 RepID=A0A4C1TD20_EUMVA|nr:hypothetical protein EVAR_73418_1 [Eumeta japonica]
MILPGDRWSPGDDEVLLRLQLGGLQCNFVDPNCTHYHRQTYAVGVVNELQMLYFVNASWFKELCLRVDFWLSVRLAAPLERSEADRKFTQSSLAGSICDPWQI